MFLVVTNFSVIKLSCVRLLVTKTTKWRLNFWAFCTQPYIGDYLVIYYLEHAAFGSIAVFCVMCLYTPVFLHRRATARCWALASIIPGLRLIAKTIYRAAV
jgi:ABC-type protease/lipase transport system fused ATPase/permease subunit